MANLIKTAVKVGGPDPATNSLLAQHLDAARRMGFPKEKITNAIESVLFHFTQLIYLSRVQGRTTMRKE
jgi:transcriptional/translational regulatory protein YebC/TACO1